MPDDLRSADLGSPTLHWVPGGGRQGW